MKHKDNIKIQSWVLGNKLAKWTRTRYQGEERRGEERRGEERRGEERREENKIDRSIDR